ncbi:MAG: M55 family metallopeptidase [Deltaproteobacteria bacterium]|nr:M55 family metallopeptidase [Deltaproteobacteria bacterium]
MKIFISVDLEGISCVTHNDQLDKQGGPAYEAARKWLTAETNAAVEGAMKGGATQIVVADGHNYMRNLIPDELHEDVTIINGSPRTLIQMEGIDDSFDAVFFVGHHPGAGNTIGGLAHTFFMPLVSELSLNDQPVNEVIFNSALAGHFNVPTALITGDDRLSEEVKESIPWAERVVTKWALSPYAARNLTPKKSQQMIRTAARRAIERLAEMKVIKMAAPVHLKVKFRTEISTFLTVDIPGVERIDGYTVAFKGADMVETTKILALMAYASIVQFSL